MPFHLVSLLWRWRGVRADRVLLAIAHLLVGIGFIVVLSRPDPVRDTLLITRYTQGVAVGVALFGAISLIDLDRAGFRDLSYLPLLGALGRAGLQPKGVARPRADKLEVLVGSKPRQS